MLVRQRPGSAKGVVFMTVEDETGVANVVVWPKVLERYRKVIMTARLIEIRGTIQRHEDIIHVVATHLEERSVRVRRGRTERLDFDFHPTECVLDVTVIWEGTPLEFTRHTPPVVVTTIRSPP